MGLLSLVLTFIFTPATMYLAKKVGAIDYPGERRVHRKPIPRLGGVAMYLSFIAAAWYFLHPLNNQIIGLLAGATVILGVGIYDDIKGVSPKAKFLGQVIAAMVLLFFGYQIDKLTLPWFGEVILPGVWGSVFVLLWVVSLVNTVNITDGLDGLAAGICFGACLVLLWSAVQIGMFQAAYLMAGLAGVCLGFLFFNFHPAKVFMGDSGSMFLGFAIAAISINGLLKTTALFGLVLPLLALGMPIFDLTFAVIRRKWRGQPIAMADRGHFHHRLLDLGLTHRQAVLALYSLSALLAGAAFFASLEDWRWAISLTMVVVSILLTVLFVKGPSELPRRTGGK